MKSIVNLVRYQKSFFFGGEGESGGWGHNIFPCAPLKRQILSARLSVKEEPM
jgi:hypothetical protein